MSPLSQIFQTYRDYVFRICSRYARCRDDAEDLTQETFLKIASRLDGFRRESELSTWLYRVAVNHCLDYLRKVRRDEAQLAAYLDDQVVANLASGGDRVLASLVLNRILAPIRPAVRQALFLTLAEGMSSTEAAAVLKMSPAAVSKCVSRFLKKGKFGASAGPVSGKTLPGSSKGTQSEIAAPWK